MHKSKIQQYARELRKNSTDAEKHLWYNLRANRMGYKFKRQVPMGSFIVDFACISKRLIIELDGGQHQDNHAYDAYRTKELNKRGFKVLRFWNNEVLQHTESVMKIIFNALSPTLSREIKLTYLHISSAGEGD
jgi:very-short-patch-repair endonuclease